MLCYRDMTFCPYYKNCKNGKVCDRALNVDVIENAKKWWENDDVPICQYSKKPDCFKNKDSWLKKT